MPRKDRKTIDLPSDLVNKYQARFNELKPELKLEGITTFQGYMSKILNKLLQEGELPDDLAELLNP